MVRQEEMDMSALDQSLDEVIAANRKKRKGGRGRGQALKRSANSGKRKNAAPTRSRSRGGKGGYRGRRRGRGFKNNNNAGGGPRSRVNALGRNKQFKRVWGNNQGAPNRPRFGQKSPFRPNGQSNSFSTTGKVVVTNLKPHVSSDDIKEIFEKFGTVTHGFVKFDAVTGASTGTAEVFYARGADARNAQMELDGAKIDEGVIRVSYAGGSPRKGRGRRFKQNPLQRQSINSY